MYTPPTSTAVNFNFTTSGYTPPAPTAVAFAFPPGSEGGGGGAATGGVSLLIGI